MELDREPETQYFKASMPSVLHMLRNKERVYNDWESATYDDILLQIEAIKNTNTNLPLQPCKLFAHRE